MFHDKRVVVPGPAVFFEHLLDRRIIQFETGRREAALLVDAGRRTLQVPDPVDVSLGDVVRHLGKEPAGPHDAYGKGL